MEQVQGRQPLLLEHPRRRPAASCSQAWLPLQRGWWQQRGVC